MGECGSTTLEEVTPCVLGTVELHCDPEQALDLARHGALRLPFRSHNVDGRYM